MKIGKNLNVWVEDNNSLASKAFLKKVNFRFTRRFVDITKGGWIGVYLEWNADAYGFKFAQKSYVSYSGNEVYYALKFSDVKYRYKSKCVNSEIKYCNANFEIKVGLNLIRDRVFKKYINIGYVPMFHENLGYGARVWFAPEKWDKKTIRFEEE